MLSRYACVRAAWKLLSRSPTAPFGGSGEYIGPSSPGRTAPPRCEHDVAVTSRLGEPSPRPGGPRLRRAHRLCQPPTRPRPNLGVCRYCQFVAHPCPSLSASRHHQPLIRPRPPLDARRRCRIRARPRSCRLLVTSGLWRPLPTCRGRLWGPDRFTIAPASRRTTTSASGWLVHTSAPVLSTRPAPPWDVPPRVGGRSASRTPSPPLHPPSRLRWVPPSVPGDTFFTSRRGRTLTTLPGGTPQSHPPRPGPQSRPAVWPCKLRSRGPPMAVPPPHLSRTGAQRACRAW